jgi:chemotaxis protein CheD
MTIKDFDSTHPAYAEGKRKKMHRGKYFSKTTYYDRLFNSRAVRILPGEYHASSNGTVISTVLGSCVSVCLYDSKSGVGGMNHYLLPQGASGKSGLYHGSARYGVHAMELLLEHTLLLGADRSNIRAKVFGAGRVIQGMRDVGGRNSDFAVTYLHDNNIPVAALDVGSNFPRKLYFFPATGRAFVRKIRTRMNSGRLAGATDCISE